MDDGSATPVSRALWFIESHFGRELTLEEIADACCVSRYHMSRVWSDIASSECDRRLLFSVESN